MKDEVILIGGGGHCRACIDVIERGRVFGIKGILDVEEHVGDSVLGYPVIGVDRDIPVMVAGGYWFLIALGQIRTPEKRVRLFDTLKHNGARLATVVSPSASVSPHADLGEGTIVMHGAQVGPCAHIGSNCIVNTCAVVEHDTVVESHCHIAPGAVVNGGVHVQARTFIGSQAMVREGVLIGDSSFIGAGCRVKDNVERASIIKER